MNPNIYHFAHTEYAQDAFISWLCACYNQNDNEYKRDISKKFIREMLGVSISFSTVSIKNQYLNIDILLTLESENERYFVIIEDKKFSKYHGRQLEKYIDSLIKAERTSADKIFVVYYKTGHISKTPNWIYFKDKKFFYDTSITSELDTVNAVKDRFPSLRKLTICDLSQINSFFMSADIQNLIMNSGSEILNDYSCNIHELYKALYETKCLPARIEHAEQQEIWGKVFDDFIYDNAASFEELSFKLDLYSGVYWEIYITQRLKSSDGECNFPNQPILNVRADIFKRKRKQMVYFFLVPESSSLIDATRKEVKQNKCSYSYIIEWEKLKNETLRELRLSDDYVNIENFKLFLSAICEEFKNSMSENRQFEL